MSDLELVQLSINQTHVYRIPPRPSAQGWYCQAWRPEDRIFTGRLKVITTGSECIIRIENTETNQVFVEARYRSADDVERALDSSRYFIVTVEDPNTKRKAQIGIGFERREESFDFNVALQNFLKPHTDAIAPNPELNLGLKEGEKIHININVPKKKHTSSKPAGSGGFSLKLAPPPK
ncbi:Adaptin ear-binding coat-associated protein 1 NECAP-1 [Carpediemonas membranifera]|uniref:Adaptin ear-binding coat-associated protein 1 NECAP-1 n=1 Tax=Carpediemonas membranifera TaxID=201153 RepID=A0A8J6B8Y8_9EUKA|nr:Adaptin ear-binding coat-associated protein 1 NECAP-1 [Carpediemonas membranifera]|eukprot:KAG9395654.1 Adaptin ear-binding coat-associated protein 1 NECAP-1 [Carpediemonas membranifera]